MRMISRTGTMVLLLGLIMFAGARTARGICVVGPCDDNDGNPCTEGVCSSGSCVPVPVTPGTPCTLASPNECLTAECNLNGECGTPKVGAACTDQTPDNCLLAKCDDRGMCDQTADTRPGACDDDDGNPCTEGVCRSGFCESVPATGSCDDGNACTTGDMCDGSECVAGPPLDCDDGDTCTIDRCEDGECACSADPACARQGCTPGYWKNNATSKSANAWTPTMPMYMPSTKIAAVFTIPSCSGKLSSSLGTSTLLQGLKFDGNTSLNGTAKLLLRSGIAALLNSASPCVQYPLCWNEVVDLVDAAMASCTRSTMLSQTSQLDGLNSLTCPLNQQGRCMNR